MGRDAVGWARFGRGLDRRRRRGASHADRQSLSSSGPPAPARGEVWLADLSPTRGHEQAGRRPVLVISEDVYNLGPADLVVLPLTSTVRSIACTSACNPRKAGSVSRVASSAMPSG